MDSGTEVLLALARSPDGRLQGTIQRPGAPERLSFSGTLELLRALEDAIGEAPSPTWDESAD
jgi:hypothetical protein